MAQFSQTEFEAFLKTQIELLDETNKTIEKNALDWHRERCDLNEANCDMGFLDFFLIAFVQHLTKDRAELINETIAVVDVSGLN